MKVKITKEMWEKAGAQAGWTKTASGYQCSSDSCGIKMDKKDIKPGMKCPSCGSKVIDLEGAEWSDVHPERDRNRAVAAKSEKVVKTASEWQCSDCGTVVNRKDLKAGMECPNCGSPIEGLEKEDWSSVYREKVRNRGVAAKSEKAVKTAASDMTPTLKAMTGMMGNLNNWYALYSTGKMTPAQFKQNVATAKASMTTQLDELLKFIAPPMTTPGTKAPVAGTPVAGTPGAGTAPAGVTPGK